MEKIVRNKVVIETEEIEVPEGNKICERCKGAGMVSKYDLGWKSIVHSPTLAVKRECFLCKGLGYRLDYEKING